MSISMVPPLPPLPPLPPPSGAMSHPGSNERKAEIYVLREHINGRPYHDAPNPNAAHKDLAAIYAVDRLAAYPVIKDNFEHRELKRNKRIRDNKAWASLAIDAIIHGTPIPTAANSKVKRERAVLILKTLLVAGPLGATRKEICSDHGIDGGKVSGALSLLHEAAVIARLVDKR